MPEDRAQRVSTIAEGCGWTAKDARLMFDLGADPFCNPPDGWGKRKSALPFGKFAHYLYEVVDRVREYVHVAFGSRGECHVLHVLHVSIDVGEGCKNGVM